MNARERFNHAYDNRHRCGVLGAQDIEMMCVEIERLRADLFDAHQALERAWCEGQGYEEGYGWPVGDHTPDSMADSIIKRIADLRPDAAVGEWVRENPIVMPLYHADDVTFGRGFWVGRASYRDDALNAGPT